MNISNIIPLTIQEQLDTKGGAYVKTCDPKHGLLPANMLAMMEPKDATKAMKQYNEYYAKRGVDAPAVSWKGWKGLWVKRVKRVFIIHKPF